MMTRRETEKRARGTLGDFYRAVGCGVLGCLARTGIVLAAVMATPAALAQTVAVVAATPSDEPAAQHLMTQIEGDATRRTTDLAREPEKLIEQAQAQWHERMVVVIDTESGFVKVLRTWDGMVLTRSLERAVARSSPYAVAVAAVELLELAGHEPPRHELPNVPDPVLPPPLTPPPTTEPTDIEPEKPSEKQRVEPPPSPRKLRAVLNLGGLLTVSLGGDVTMIQPTIGLGMMVEPFVGNWWIGVDGHGAAFGAKNRGVVPADREASGELDVRYEREELGLRLSTGTGASDSGLFGFLNGGLSFISVIPRGEDGSPVGGRDRIGGWAGAGGGLRYSLEQGPGLELSVGAMWLSGGRTYRAVDTPAFDEGPLHLRVAAGVFWGSP
jgi:hypothetical protein